jgi:hypothetical protein
MPEQRPVFMWARECAAGVHFPRMVVLGSAPAQPTPELAKRVEEQLGKRAVDWRKPHTGLTPAQRFVVRLEDGSSVFVKAAVDDWTERGLRTDHLVLSTVKDLVPEVIAWIDEPPHPVLILEDLHDAHWPADHFREIDGQTLPVLWKEGQRDLLMAALERLARIPAPPELAELPPLAEVFAPEWPEIAAAPGPFLGLGLCSAAWLERSLAALLAAERALDLSGDALVHNDVRSDNVCFRGERVLLVDWTDARRGSPRFDLANFLGGGVVEDGPDPYAHMPDAGGFAAWRAAQLANRALHEASSPRWLLAVFARMARDHLTWAAKCLALPPP